MPSTKEKLDLDFYSKSPQTKSCYLTVINKYKPETWDRWELLKFFKELQEKHGWSDTSLRTAYYAIKKLYDIEEKPWPIKLSDLPKTQESSVNRPVLGRKEVGKMIQWARGSGIYPVNYYLALSTIYGMRRAEMAVVGEEDIQDGKILIRTAKGGMQRWTAIPEEIQKYITHNPGLGATSIAGLFHYIAYKSGADIPKGRIGFHSIRRTLFTLLIDAGITLPFAYNFLRWKLAGMPGVYFQPDSGAVDREIFEKHPFLGFWG